MVFLAWLGWLQIAPFLQDTIYLTVQNSSVYLLYNNGSLRWSARNCLLFSLFFMTHHVCAVGRVPWVGAAMTWNLGLSSPKPPAGSWEQPVVNWRSLAISSWVKLFTTVQNQSSIWDEEQIHPNNNSDYSYYNRPIFIIFRQLEDFKLLRTGQYSARVKYFSQEGTVSPLLFNYVFEKLYL